MGLKDQAIAAAKGYLKSNPTEIVHVAKNVLGLRICVPMAALRWLSQQAEASGKVKYLDLQPRPPGISFTVDVDLMETPVRAAAVIYIERVNLSEEELSIALRVEDVKLKVTGEAAPANGIEIDKSPGQPDFKSIRQGILIQSLQ